MPSKERQSSNRSVLMTLFAVIGLLIVADSLGKEQEPERVSVIIIDPLSPYSEGDFTSSCVELFRSAGYDVEVIGGSEVSVDRLKSIPSGCSALVMRVHSGVFEDSVWFFTGERYDSTRHVLEQLANEVHIARATRDSDLFFAVGSSFVRRFMKEELEGALVVLMGCDGLASSELAEAFLDAGAAAYVSWDGPVSLAHTDRATLALLEGVTGGLTLEESVEHALRQVGPDLRYGSSLKIYPSKGAEFVLRGGQSRR
ncbi:hypothetical protein HQ586_00350 [Candidatus Bathyarchaeota archaeon]|nr:hypothetical protein [Candidatus Bathyarchaeota archaeon]